MERKYSGKQIINAGKDFVNLDDLLEDNNKFEAVMDILSYWRFSHEEPLKDAVSKIQPIVLKKDKNAIFAKRLKRHISIFNKLNRFKKMNLKNMQDIGGCRAIVTNEKKLRQCVRELRKLSSFQGNDRKYRFKDYIKKPKEDGYRSYHLIGKFKGSDGKIKNIELQLRTKIQHYWATALEVVDLFTDQALKSNQGDEVWRSFFKNVGEQFSVMDRIHLFTVLEPANKLIRYTEEVKNDRNLINSCKSAKKLCGSLKVQKMLAAFAASIKIVERKIESTDDSGYALLKIDTSGKRVYTTIFNNNESKIAEKAYIELEKEAAQTEGIVVALVSTTAVGGIKEAYPNYFADTTEFANHLSLIESAKI